MILFFGCNLSCQAKNKYIIKIKLFYYGFSKSKQQIQNKLGDYVSSLTIFQIFV